MEHWFQGACPIKALLCSSADCLTFNSKWLTLKPSVLLMESKVVTISDDAQDASPPSIARNCFSITMGTRQSVAN